MVEAHHNLHSGASFDYFAILSNRCGIGGLHVFLRRDRARGNLHRRRERLRGLWSCFDAPVRSTLAATIVLYAAAFGVVFAVLLTGASTFAAWGSAGGFAVETHKLHGAVWGELDGWCERSQTKQAS